VTILTFSEYLIVFSSRVKEMSRDRISLSSSVGHLPGKIKRKIH